MFTGGAAIVDLPDIKAAIEENVVGLRQSDGMPEIPLFVHHGLRDKIIDVTQTEHGFNRLCEFGVESFELAILETTGHLAEMV